MADRDFERSFTELMHNSTCVLCGVTVASSATPWALTLLKASHVCSAMDLEKHEAAFVANGSADSLRASAQPLRKNRTPPMRVQARRNGPRSTPGFSRLAYCLSDVGFCQVFTPDLCDCGLT